MAQNISSNVHIELESLNLLKPKRKASYLKQKLNVSSTSFQNPEESTGLTPQKRRNEDHVFMRTVETSSTASSCNTPNASLDKLQNLCSSKCLGTGGCGFKKSGCEVCAHVSDNTSWAPVDPKISTGKDGTETFDLRSVSGRHQCSRSGVRWLCSTEVSLQYCYASWGQFREELARSCYKPAGPLIDIKVLSGELDEVYLPHFMCIGDPEEDVKHGMKILHGQVEKVSFETCEVVQSHARLICHSFSPMGPVIIDNPEHAGLAHCKLLHYRHSPTSFRLRTYLIPEDKRQEDDVRHQEEERISVPVLLPDPVRPLRMGTSYKLSTTPISTVTPPEMLFRSYNATPNFYQVVMNTERFEFDLALTQLSDNESVWTGTIQENYFEETTVMTSETNFDEAVQFVDMHRSTIIDSIKIVSPLVEEMLSRKLINSEKRSIIMASSTSEEKMRSVYDCLNTPKGKAIFYAILQEKEHLLVEFLNNPRLGT